MSGQLEDNILSKSEQKGCREVDSPFVSTKSSTLFHLEEQLRVNIGQFKVNIFSSGKFMI